MAKFTWQDGTLVSKAKVEINGTIYEVDPEEYSGATPLSASNLNAMQDGIYEDIDKKMGRLTKLWENPNESSDFDSQNITLSSDNYDYLIIFWLNYKDSNKLDSIITLKGYGAYLNLASDYGIGSGNYNVASYTRELNRTSDVLFNFSKCYARYGSSAARPESNANIIPVAIYGGKF